MTNAFAAFGRNDLRGVGRDTLLAGMFLAPLVWIAMVRFATPPVTRLLAENQVDLRPYYPLILVGFLLLTSAIIVGGVTALIVLEERDANTLAAVRITPASLGRYIGYRAIIAVLLTTVYVIGTITASGLFPARHLPALIPIGLLTGLSALVIALAILAVAKNKVEGIAAIRALGIVVAGLPLLPAFIDSNWQLAFGVLPTYWPAQAFLTASDGGTWWPYLIGGIAYHALVVWPLYRRFIRAR
ncbi:ABC transporter permease [Kibdelosporangium persicum]|uniref:Antibiotic-transport integral membrane leucine and alanine and valine rich protein abc transporter n=1 Tax=Kibdelosporangium persicum TaxID=2698649 RepID=A0ABX2FGX3_9PSEU|nr:ABC transporter permease [Kibdelosporangium persicum]NRN70641.1 Antibiotic-transport integral membrane leucine and alanine and valine rich protein abc transporter [Kibdelosporangium persicum]